MYKYKHCEKDKARRTNKRQKYRSKYENINRVINPDRR
jgi:hypothetical protein